MDNLRKLLFEYKKSPIEQSLQPSPIGDFFEELILIVLKQDDLK